MTAATQPSQLGSPVVWHALTTEEVAVRLGGELFKIVLRSRRKARKPTAAPVPAV